ncbi:hypothetical protein ARMGADRAFT_466771 [Armillaria gallica]|uniref:Uncharacterized protein n=1 Tax=Armillaria gallica TaxID=47427 RepID=A0A2H3DDC3_ARMGA|nr:hypothetical protein ARMGADRAFT_670145 [Armillaria gallica]PBK87087.1 hypothetical protein ARMGADRAFT_466771 [Armillaria gallica]
MIHHCQAPVHRSWCNMNVVSIATSRAPSRLIWFFLSKHLGFDILLIDEFHCRFLAAPAHPTPGLVMPWDIDQCLLVKTQQWIDGSCHCLHIGFCQHSVLG